MDGMHMLMAIIIAALLIYIAWYRCGFTVSDSAASPAPTTTTSPPKSVVSPPATAPAASTASAAPAASAASATDNTGKLLALLRKKADWFYYDETLKQRVILSFTFNSGEPQTLNLKLSVSKNPPTKLNWVYQGTDSMLVTEPGKPASAYQLIIKYIDDKTIYCKETENGNVTFDQQLK